MLSSHHSETAFVFDDFTRYQYTVPTSQLQICHNYAEVAELADAHDSNSCGAIHVGSIPTFGTRLPSFLHMQPHGMIYEETCLGYITPSKKGCVNFSMRMDGITNLQ